MKKEDLSSKGNNFSRRGKNKSEKGSAILIALFIMLLLLSFVALAVTRTTNETVASSNDQAETRTFAASHASLEVMTRNFNKIFDRKLNPDATDLTRIQGQFPPGFDNYDFDQTLTQTASRIVTMTGDEFQGLSARRDTWILNTTATEASTGVQVALRREFFNNRIPIFQFGIFYEDDLELHPGPRFDFGGRVHSNGSMFLMAGTGLYFTSKVTAVKHIFTDVAKNGVAATNWGENVYIKNAAGSYVQLKNNMGSVLNTVVNGSPETIAPLYPTTYKSVNWKSNMNLFQGNLSIQDELNLPLKLNSKINQTPVDLVEIIKRGKTVGDLYNFGAGAVAVTAATADDAVTFKERYYNKAGIRVSLADSKAKLPGCATAGGAAVTTDCGVRLDGDDDGLGSDPIPSTDARGYIPRPMVETVGNYRATRINGERFYVSGKQMWIKVETVGYNNTTNLFEAADITQDMLSLGVTEQAKTILSGSTPLFKITETDYAANNYDSRSVIKLQRFMFSGANVGNSNSDPNFITNSTWNGVNYNYVHAARQPTLPTLGAVAIVDSGSYGGVFGGDHQQHRKRAIVDISTNNNWIVPFPINMFDTREGLYYEGTSVFNPTAAANYGSKVPWAGVMSMIDIDVKNLKDFLDGDFDGKMPVGTPFAIGAGRTLRSTDIHDSNGWVLYVSDRRGDSDFDGEYDMEDIYGNNDGILQLGEDINNNGSLQTDYFNEAVRYTGFGASESPDIAAVFDHKFYRRGVRLINGTQLPGIFDSVTPGNTQGFTVASENGVYVFGNYNATGIGSVGTPTPSTDYLPQDTASHIPASIAADAVTILSNNWSDARSFTAPFNLAQRTANETFIRFAMLSGDTKTSLNGTPNQGGSDPRLAGGVHNFKRFLENWGGQRLNYTGSLINLYNSHNNNGAFKCCAMVYSPPTRNWVFDQTFLDPNRLPPGTPFFQSIRITGFQRVN